MRTANPALNDRAFDRAAEADYSGYSMTIEGTVNKTGILLMLVIGAAAYTWHLFETAGVEATLPWMLGGLAGGFVFALVTIFKPTIAMYTAPLYALCEGLLLGGISAQAEMRAAQFAGGGSVVIPAVGLTFGVLLALLIVYRLGIIKATENFKLGVVAATGGICLLYVASIGLGFFGISIPFIHDGGPIGIGFSLFVVVIASLNLVLDFDFIESGAEHGAPKYMEWYAAFGLLVTLVWLYLEILRLLSKLQRN